MKTTPFSFSRCLPALCTIAISMCCIVLPACSGKTSGGTPYSLTTIREVEARLPATLADTHEAALEVLRDEFKYRITSEALDAREGFIEARTARDDKVTVETFFESERITLIQIFVGSMGDEEAAASILDRIAEEVD